MFEPGEPELPDTVLAFASFGAPEDELVLVLGLPVDMPAYQQNMSAGIEFDLGVASP